MDETIKSKLSFLGYNVKEVVFKVNDKFKNDGKPIDIQFSLTHETIIKEKRMNIELNLEVFNNMEENNYPFTMKVTTLGKFAIQGDNIENFEINGIAILYPYLRAIVSTYTANSNIPTLILPPINVSTYINKYKNKKD